MWEKVAKRSHKPEKIYSFGSNSNDVMINGTVEYELKDGKSAIVDWSARAHLKQEDGELKMDFYQVYLVSRWRAYWRRNSILTKVLGYGGDGSSEVEHVRSGRAIRHPFAPYVRRSYASEAATHNKYGSFWSPSNQR